MKILDFGLAKLIQGPEAMPSGSAALTLAQETKPGTLLGTIGYMSPEQVRGEPADARSDIFSLGAVLFEILTGKQAFKGDSHVETLHAILKQDPPAIEGRDLPATLALIVRRCLEKDVRERFQSARDIALALETSSLAPDPAGPPAPRAGGRALRLAAAVVLLVAAGASLGPLQGWLRGRSPATIRSIAVLPLQDLSGPSAQDYFADGLTEALITDIAKARSLKVISRTSVMQYKETKKPLPEIARALGVEAIIAGSVVRSGDRVRITAQLIDASTDQHLWAEEYEGDLRDVLALQRDVARSIARSVHVALTTYARVADVYLALGRHSEALAALEKGRTTAGSTSVRQSEGLAVVLAASGKRPEATAILERLEETARHSDQVAYSIALVHTALGHTDQAIRWRERAFEERSPLLFMLDVELKFDSIRADPRFQALLARMGFPRRP